MPYYRCPACGLMSHSVAAYSTAGVCANCAAKLPDHAKLYVVPGTAPTLSCRVGASIDAPARARRAASSLPLDEAARRRVALVVSELVTNSVRHAGLAPGDPIELEVSRDNGAVRVSVHDKGPGFSTSVHTTPTKANRGLGLALVETLAREWGVDHRPDGFTVWCAVDAEGVAA